MFSAKAEQCVEVCPEGVCARDIAQIFVVSICTLVQVLAKQVNLQTRQNLCFFFTRKASKIEYLQLCVCARLRHRPDIQASVGAFYF
jgi:hypothetical protein